MLPSYPKIVDLRSKLNAAEVKQWASRLSPILSQIKSHIQFEGGGNIILRHDNTVGDEPLQTASAELKTKIMPLEEFTPEYLAAQLQEAGKQFAKQMSQYFYNTMDKVTAESGNVVDAKGKSFSEDMLLEMLEKMDHSFKADGSWNAPTGFVGSDAFKAIEKLNNKSDEEKRIYNEKLEKLLEKKRDEFNRREADRVLAG